MSTEGDPYETDLAVLLRRCRTRRGFTQEHLAEASGVAVRTIRDLEAGTSTRPRLRTANRLAAALGLPPAEEAVLVELARSAGLAQAARNAPLIPGKHSRCLPRDLPDFVGREAELGSLLRPGADRLIAITGPAGIGKTSLAVNAAHRLPGSALFVELADADQRALPIAGVLGQLLLAFGVEMDPKPHNIGAHLAGWQRMTAQHQGVLILDNVVVADVARHVIPVGPGWRVLVTSRQRLPYPVEIQLRPLPLPAALQLLVSVIGEDRVVAEPGAAAELVASCGAEPFALRRLANRLAGRPAWSLSSVLDRAEAYVTRQ